MVTRAGEGPRATLTVNTLPQKHLNGISDTFVEKVFFEVAKWHESLRGSFSTFPNIFFPYLILSPTCSAAIHSELVVRALLILHNMQLDLEEVCEPSVNILHFEIENTVLRNKSS